MNNKWKQLINTQSLYSSTLKKKDITFSHFVKKSFHPSKQSFLRLAELTKDECWNWNLHPKLGSFDVCTLRVIRYWRVKRVTNRAKLQSPNRCLHTRTHTHTRAPKGRQKRKRGGRERGSTVTKWLVAVRTLRQRESNHVCRLMGRARARDRSTGALRDANRFSGVAPGETETETSAEAVVKASGEEGDRWIDREREREGPFSSQ